MDFSFSDSKVVDSLDRVPKDFQGLYEPLEDGKFGLSADPKVKSAVGAIVGLNEALKAARAEAKSKKSVDLSPLANYGSSPEEIASSIDTRIKELEEAAAGSKEAKLNVDKVRDELAKAHAKELGARDAKIGGLRGQLQKLLVENASKSALANLKGDVDLLLPHMSRHIRTVEEEGEFKVYVVDPAGDKRYSGVTGQPMTIEELAQEFKASEKYGKLFASEAPSGGGARPSTTYSSGPKPMDSAKMTPAQKIAAGLQQKRR